MKISVPVFLLVLISFTLALITSYHVGYQAGKINQLSPKRVQAEIFCRSTGHVLSTIAFQTKAKSWSFQCE